MFQQHTNSPYRTPIEPIALNEGEFVELFPTLQSMCLGYQITLPDALCLALHSLTGEDDHNLGPKPIEKVTPPLEERFTFGFSHNRLRMEPVQFLLSILTKEAKSKTPLAL